MIQKVSPPTWMFSRHIPSGNKTCVRTEPKTDHNDHDLSHGYLCKKKSNLCPLCALLSNIWTIKLFCWTKNHRILYAESSLIRALYQSLSVSSIFPPPSPLILWIVFLVILSIWNFPSVEHLWYYGYYFLSDSRYFKLSHLCLLWYRVVNFSK